MVGLDITVHEINSFGFWVGTGLIDFGIGNGLNDFGSGIGLLGLGGKGGGGASVEWHSQVTVMVAGAGLEVIDFRLYTGVILYISGPS